MNAAPRFTADKLDGTSNEHERLLAASVACGRVPHHELVEVFQLVHASDFVDSDLAAVYATARNIHQSGAAITAKAIELESTFSTGFTDGHFLTLAKDGLIAYRSVRWHAAKVAENATRRRLLSMLRDAVSHAETTQDLLSLVGSLEADIRGFGVRTWEDEGTHAGDAAQESFVQIMDGWKNQKNSGIPTGLQAIDDAIGGMQPGTMIVLAARPSIGKSCLGAEIAQRVAEAGSPVVFCSLEMSDREMGDRFLSRATGLPSDYIRQPVCLNASDLEMLEAAVKRIKQIPLILWGKVGTPVGKLKAFCRRMRAQGKLDFLVVDYIGLLRGEGGNTREQVTNCSLELKALSQELGIPVLVCCQLNRQSEKADGKGGKTISKPTLAELRDSGAIEQDADGVWFLVRERDSSDATLSIAKYRNGRTGDVKLYFDGEHSHVKDVPVTSHENYRPEFSTWGGQ